jgi:hypothetical protein
MPSLNIWNQQAPVDNLEGASDTGKGLWNNVSSYIWGQQAVQQAGQQTPVENLDYTDGEFLKAISAMEELGNYSRAPLAKRVEAISNKLGWSAKKAQHLLEDQGIDAEFSGEGGAEVEDRLRARQSGGYNLRPRVPVRYGR